MTWNQIGQGWNASMIYLGDTSWWWYGAFIAIVFLVCWRIGVRIEKNNRQRFGDKITVVVLTIVVAMSLTACGKGSNPSPTAPKKMTPLNEYQARSLAEGRTIGGPVVEMLQETNGSLTRSTNVWTFLACSYDGYPKVIFVSGTVEDSWVSVVAIDPKDSNTIRCKGMGQ